MECDGFADWKSLSRSSARSTEANEYFKRTQAHVCYHHSTSRDVSIAVHLLNIHARTESPSVAKSGSLFFVVLSLPCIIFHQFHCHIHFMHSHLFLCVPLLCHTDRRCIWPMHFSVISISRTVKGNVTQCDAGCLLNYYSTDFSWFADLFTLYSALLLLVQTIRQVLMT